MNKHKTSKIVGLTIAGLLIGLLIAVLLCGGIFFSCVPEGRAMWASYQNSLTKSTTSNSYESRKKVEDTCRASISSYKTDKLTYEQYKDSDSELEQSWAEAAKMRANKTANIYNEYFRKNSYVFKGNVPDDIDYELETIE